MLGLWKLNQLVKSNTLVENNILGIQHNWKIKLNRLIKLITYHFYIEIRKLIKHDWSVKLIAYD